MVSLTVLNQAVFADRTELRLIVLVFDDAHSGISLAIPGSFLKKVMEWREEECSLRGWRDFCAWGTKP